MRMRLLGIGVTLVTLTLAACLVAAQPAPAKQFHVEGFVNHYVADSVMASPDSIVFRSEAIENIPPGFRARETYRILGPGEFVERFEMAEPNSEFAMYSEARFKRKK